MSGESCLPTAALPTPASPPYRRTVAVDNSSFLSAFDFYTQSDPTHGFVRFADEGGVGVRVDVYGDAADPHVVSAAEDAARDLSAVGDEERGEAHRRNTP